MNVTASASPPFFAPAFHHGMRVYWEDTDAGGIVFYVNYLKFFERARTEWLRHRGYGQQRIMESADCIFIVRDAHVRYLKPARLDDWLSVSVDVQERRPASLHILQRAQREQTLLAETHIRIGYVHRATMKPQRIPSSLFEALA